MLRKCAALMWLVLGFVALSAVPALANPIMSATATANCQGYNLTVKTESLVIGQSYTIDYNFALTCNGGQPVNVPGQITFTATAKRQTVTASGTFPGLSGSCYVTGTAQLVGQPKVYTIIINGVKKAPLTCSNPITANCASIVAEQGIAITPVTIQASGGVGPPYTFTAVGLPTGLTISSSGTISGTPTVSGNFSYTVTIKDSAGNTGTINCSITVNPPLQVTCSEVNTGDVGVPFNSGPIPVTGGVAPYTFSISSGALPPGLSLNTSTGAVTGTPTASGTFAIKATDALGASSIGCTITINPALQLTCSKVNTGDVGVPFSSGPMTVTGGTAPYTFSIGSGTLPPGLSLNTSTGAVTGTATAPGTFTIKVTDALGATATGCMITINPALQVTCSSVNTGDVGVAFNSGPMTVTGGTAPYTFSIGSGTLPSGLTLNTSTGAVTGTPTAPGAFSIKVTDALGATGGNCTITINAAIQVTCSQVTSGKVGQPFNSGAITVVGGTPPYVFSIATGKLPAGLTLNTSTGAVTGTPTVAGSFSIKVTDADGAVGSPTCPITITGSACITSQLGPAAGFALLGLQNSLIQLSGSNPQNIQGNVGIGVDGQIEVDGHGNYPGTLYADPSANLQIQHGVGFDGGIVTQSMTAIQNAVATEESYVASLTPTQTFNQINQATTIYGNGGLNVIQVNGGINLSWRDLTIQGGTNDSFFFQINGSVALDNANINLNGIAANQVLFYVMGSGNQMNFGSSNTEGIFLVDGNIQVTGGTHTSEFVAGGHISFVGDCGKGSTVVNVVPACGGGGCTPTPIVPYIQVDWNGWQQTNTVTIKSCYHQVNLGPQPLNGGSWSWTGPNGFSSTQREIDKIPLSNGTNIYTATYTDSNGCQSTETFTIKVE